MSSVRKPWPVPNFHQLRPLTVAQQLVTVQRFTPSLSIDDLGSNRDSSIKSAVPRIYPSGRCQSKEVKLRSHPYASRWHPFRQNTKSPSSHIILISWYTAEIWLKKASDFLIAALSKHTSRLPNWYTGVSVKKVMNPSESNARLWKQSAWPCLMLFLEIFLRHRFAAICGCGFYFGIWNSKGWFFVHLDVRQRLCELFWHSPSFFGVRLGTLASEIGKNVPLMRAMTSSWLVVLFSRSALQP